MYYQKTKNYILCEFKKKYYEIEEYKTRVSIYPETTKTHILKQMRIVNKNIKKIDHSLQFEKLTFLGRGYKIRKKKNLLFPYFNKAHLNVFLLMTIIAKKIRKNKIILYTNSYSTLRSYSRLFVHLKKLNIYTKKGLRTATQPYIKKKGKSNIG